MERKYLITHLISVDVPIDCWKKKWNLNFDELAFFIRFFIFNNVSHIKDNNLTCFCENELKLYMLVKKSSVITLPENI